MGYGLSLCIQGTRVTLHGWFLGLRFIPVYTGNTMNRYPRSSWTPVYPCVYREHILIRNNSIWNIGLSLCIQGTRLPTVHFSHFCRFIPVYTGNTLYYFINHKRGTVYPCVYREHMTSSLLKLSKSGLSLCIQGTQLYTLLKESTRRFIPVYTGNTKSIESHFYIHPVYPCVYREHLPCLVICAICNGLSLCIQGTL